MKLAKITLAENESENKYSSCTVYTVLMTVVSKLLFILFITIGLWLKIMFIALNLVFVKKQRFSKHINGRNKTNYIKNRTYHFYNDKIDLKDFDAKFLKIDKKDNKDIDIYYIAYVAVKKIANCNNINSVNPLYLMINEMIVYFEEKNGIKYLVLDDVDKNKEVSKKYEEVWEVIKKEIETINGGEKIEYEKYF